MITEESKPIRTEVPWREIDGNIIVVQPREGHLYPLNGVATRIWFLLDGRRDVAKIIGTITAEFEGDAEEIRKDTLLFLEELEKASLVQSNHSTKAISQKQKKE